MQSPACKLSWLFLALQASEMSFNLSLREWDRGQGDTTPTKKASHTVSLPGDPVPTTQLSPGILAALCPQM